jgi:hypothetical protein
MASIAVVTDLLIVHKFAAYKTDAELQLEFF